MGYDYNPNFLFYVTVVLHNHLAALKSQWYIIIIVYYEKEDNVYISFR